MEFVNDFDEFPDEIWFDIFYFLDPKTLLKVNTVSKRFYKISNSNFVWEPLFTKLCKNKHTHWMLKTAPVTDQKKTLYFHAVKDSKRTLLTKDELVSIGWKFRFLHGVGPDANIVYTFYPYFSPDGSYHHEGLGINQDFFYFIKDNGKIQINQFPAHTPKRTDDWG